MKKILILILFFLCINVNASIVVMDADSGRVLYEENKDKKMLIASTTKIMTSLIAIENSNINKEIIVKDEIDKAYGSMIYVKKGEKFLLKDMLYGLMLRSGNDAALIIANNVTNYDEFISLMNIKAYKLGMYNTQYNNPHGLDEETQNYSSAYDLALLMKYAIKNKIFMEITRTKTYKVNNYIWHNKNELLNSYKYATSGKIGYTKKSGPVYVSSSTKDNKNIVIASINENDKFNLHKNLYEKYFNEYKKYKILDKNTFSFKVKNKKNIHYYIKNDFNMLLKEGEANELNIKININEKTVYVYLKKQLIHKEKIYELKYENKKIGLNKLLSFFKK